MIHPAAAMAMYQVLTQLLAGRVAPATLQFHTGALGAVALLPFAASVWVAPPSMFGWTLLIAIGAFAWAGHEALTRAHAHAAASALAPFGYSFVIYLSLAGWLVFAEALEINVVVGAVLIFTAGYALWKQPQPAPERTPAACRRQ